jgi:CBS domain-containing protein
MAMIHAMTETVEQVMTGRPVTVRPETTVGELYALMQERGVACCPVVSETGELRGMVSRVDLLRTLRPSRELSVRSARDVAELTVREIMRCGIITLEPEDPLVAAVDLFVDSRLHALPVVRRGSGAPMVEGIVTQHDVLRHLMQHAVRSR